MICNYGECSWIPHSSFERFKADVAIGLEFWSACEEKF